MKEELTGIILAGGKSSRMGFDKGLAVVDGKKMIEHVFDSLSKVVDRVIVIANSDVYDFLNVPVFEDIYREKGPLSGIYTGLHYSESLKNLIVACDMPFVNSSIFEKILSCSANNQVVIPEVKGMLEPLCGYYHKGIEVAVKNFIEEDQLAVHKALKSFDFQVVKIVGEEKERLFKNINSKEDLLS